MKKWKLLSLFSAFLFLFMIIPSVIFACDCAISESPTEELERVSSVFSGKVIEIYDKNSSNPIQSTADELVIKIEVDQIWKGLEQSEVLVYTERDSASCGYPFSGGKEYLVYAVEDQDGDMRVSLCSRTAELKDATLDLEELGEGIVPTEEVKVDIPKSVVAEKIFSPIDVIVIVGVLIISVLFLRAKRKRN